MTKSTITREESIQAVFDLKVGYPLGLADIEILKRVARMALVAMGSEPVAYISKSDFDAGYPHILARRDFNNACTMPVYAAQPVPVAYSDFESFWSSYIHPLAQDDELKGFAWDIWCAAMLQAGTLTNEDTKQAWTGIPDIDNAINMLDRIDTLESCDDDRIEAVKTVLRGLAGNSPVITDSSADMLRRWLAFGRGMQNAGSQLPHNLIAETEAMIAAAPHDTPALNSVQSVVTVPGKWIPVSERMPEDRTQVILWDAEIGEVTSGHYSHKTQTFYHCGDAIENEITHWMPPPCAPQEVK
ncbi:DUF551 domain-containing protein [Klebsiella pneumoniae]